jgi:predicted amidohydrolase
VDDDEQLWAGAGQARAVECGAAVSVSGGCGGAEAGDPDAKCPADASEPVEAVSVPGRWLAGIFFVFLFVVSELGRCEADAAGWVAGCRKLRCEQLEFELVGVLEFEWGSAVGFAG